jgi:cell division protein FtsW
MNLTRISLLSSVFVLLAMGVTMLYSASMWVGDIWFHRQLQWIGWGLLAAVVAGCVGARPLARCYLPWFLYVAALVLLLLVLLPGLGTKVNGARRWLWSVQPSEFAKPAIIIALAYYCAWHLSVMGEFQPGFVRPGLLVAPFVLLLFFEPDWGTAILLAAVAGMMLSVAGVRWKFLIIAATAGLLLFLLVLSVNSVRLARFLAFLDPERWKDTYAWHVWLGMLAVSRGHWFGVGLGEGSLKLGFVPEQHTDSIFTLIGEEMGLAGTTLVVVAFMALVVSGLVIAGRAPDPFAQLLAAGITFMIGLQAFINLGVAVSLLPNKGIALPFVSYGGSSMITFLGCVGLLLGIEARSPRGPAKTLEAKASPR